MLKKDQASSKLKPLDPSKNGPAKVNRKQKTKPKRQLSPIKQKFQANFGQKFLDMVQGVEQLIEKEEIDAASTKLDGLVRFVEDTHYVDADMRKQHVNALYRLNDALEKTEENVKRCVGRHRREGNDLLVRISECIQHNEFQQAKVFTEKAVVAYRKARDSRWQTLEVLCAKLTGDEATCVAEEAFQRGDVVAAIKHGKEAQLRYREYKKSNLASQCQLLLSVALSQMEWSHVS